MTTRHVRIIFAVLIAATAAALFRRYPFHVKLLQPTTRHHPKRVCVLLTLHANTPQRETMYTDVLSRWLEGTKLDIYTVDSAASQAFSRATAERWKGALSFDQGFTGSKCYSMLELEAMCKAENTFNFEEYDLIIKITGKYYLPQLEAVLKHAPGGSLLLQNRHNFLVRYQNTELFGCPPGIFKLLKERFRKGAEQTLYAYSQLLGKAYRLPKLSVETRNARGDGSTLLWL